MFIKHGRQVRQQIVSHAPNAGEVVLDDAGIEEVGHEVIIRPAILKTAIRGDFGRVLLGGCLF